VMKNPPGWIQNVSSLTIRTLTITKVMLAIAIGALDFLDMDYKPPPTISALITSNVLDKYRRIFNFLLRVLRGESVPLNVRSS
jgi:hypothetical protein